MRTSSVNINSSLERQIIKSLVQVLADFDKTEQIDQFVRDFFTKSEIETFSKRLAIAYWIKKGRSYSNIKNNLKVSSATIATVATQMKKSGYQQALKQMEAEEWANVWAKKIESKTRFIRK